MLFSVTTYALTVFYQVLGHGDPFSAISITSDRPYDNASIFLGFAFGGLLPYMTCYRTMGEREHDARLRGRHRGGHDLTYLPFSTEVLQAEAFHGATIGTNFVIASLTFVTETELRPTPIKPATFPDLGWLS